jgi:hypothetical protein
LRGSAMRSQSQLLHTHPAAAPTTFIKAKIGNFNKSRNWNFHTKIGPT